MIDLVAESLTKAPLNAANRNYDDTVMYVTVSSLPVIRALPGHLTGCLMEQPKGQRAYRK